MEIINSVVKRVKSPVILWGLLLLGLFVLTLIQSNFFTARMWTAVDESYLFLMLRGAYEGIVNGASLWQNIAIRLFPFFDLTRFDHSGWAVYILIYITAVISACTVFLLLDGGNRKKCEVVKYLFVFLLFLWPMTLGTLSGPPHVVWNTGVVGSFYYVHLQTFCCTSALCFSLLAVKNPKCTYWFLVLLSAFFSGLSLLIIPPGGVGCCILVLLLLIGYNYHVWYKVFLFFLLGILLSMASVHLLACPLSSAFNEMFSYANRLTSTSYGAIQIIMLYGHCFRDGLLSALVVGGSLLFASKISLQWLSTLIYTVLTLIGYYYFKSFITPAWLLFWGVALVFKKKDLSLKTIILIIWPFVISLGTNCNISGRMLCFCASWLFLWSSSTRFQKGILPAGLVISFLIIFAIIETSQYKRNVGTECFSNGNRNVELLSLSTKQAAYFEESKRVLDQYGYCPDSSVVFAFSPDLCACYAFDSKLSELAFDSRRFLVSDKSRIITPDFLFLSSYDTLVIGGSLREASWGWPEEFDSYHVPAPDDYTDDRILFCRSRLLKEQ